MIRNHLRKPDSKRSQTVDGMLNFSGASKQGGSSSVKRADGFRSASSRSVNDFSGPEGFRAVNQSAGKSALASTTKAGQKRLSVLHRSLPSSLRPGARYRRGKGKLAKRSIRSWPLRTAAILGLVALLVVGFLFFKAFFSANQVFQGGGHAEALSCDNDGVDPENLDKEGDSRVNVLMLGIDVAAGLTDSILVASVDTVNNRTSTISVPRDLWVTTSITGSTKINAVYPLTKQAALNENPEDEKGASKAAIQALEGVLEEVLGLDINYYVTVDVTGFEKAVDIVGGVDINVPEELAVTEQMWDDVRNEPYYLDVPAGKQHFDAQRALFFVRSRYTSTRGDFDRSERQRLFLEALANKIASSDTLTNPVRLARLMDAFGDNVTTNLSRDDAWCLSKVVREADDVDMASIGLADEPNPVLTTGVVGDQSIVQPVAGIGVYDQIHQFLRSKLVDGYIEKEGARIVVLNGTSIADHASQTAKDMKTYGYKVVKAGDASEGEYAENIVVSLSDKPYTENYLQKRFDADVTDKLPDGIDIDSEDDIDFVVILGK